MLIVGFDRINFGKGLFVGKGLIPLDLM